MSIITWEATCKQCGSPVYYYPAKLVLERTITKKNETDMKQRMVSATCTGEIGGTKHTLDYKFPDNFKKL